MAGIRVRNKITGKTGTMPEENFDASKYERLGAAPKEAGFLTKNAPVIGEIAGGFAGPVGAGLGYSLGSSIQTIADQMRNLGPMPRDMSGVMQAGAQKLAGPRPYQKLLGSLLSPTNAFTQTIAESPEASKFVAKNIGGAGVAGATDLALGGFGSEAKLLKKLQDASPALKAVGDIPLPKGRTVSQVKGAIPSLIEKIGGPLTRVKGIKPSTIEETAGDAASASWKIIQETLDKADEAGQTIDVTKIIGKLEDAKKTISKGLDPTKIKNTRVAEKVAGFQTVIDDMKRLSGGGEAVTSIVDDGYKLTPQGVQTLKSILGQESFSPKTEMQRVFSGLFESGEQRGRKMAGGELRSTMIKYLEEQGVKNAGKVYDDWAKLSGMEKLAGQGMERLATKGAFLPSVLGGPLSAVAALSGAPGAMGIMPALYGVGTPYGRQLLRELALKPAASTIKPAVGGIVAKMLNDLSNE